MTPTIPGGIWPPFEAFYLEAMLYSTGVAMRAAADVRDALEFGADKQPGSAEWQESALAIVTGAQVIATQAAAISRFLWPPSKREAQQARARRLREGLQISDESILRNRGLRNDIEHFDERLDDFCSSLIAGRILPTYVGPLGPEPEVPVHLFRAFYTDVGVLEILGKRYPIQPILDELRVVHQRLEECSRNGSRLPYGDAS